jgi:DNA-binding MarR family transcriptional regulator
MSSKFVSTDLAIDFLYALAAMAPDRVDEIVAQWAQFRPSLDTLPIEVVARIFYVSRVLERRMEELFSAFDLNRAEFDVLVTLLRSGPPHRLAPTALSRTLLLSTSAMTNRIDRLETAGLVAREADPDDRRGIRVGLTDDGRELVERALRAHVANERRLIAALSEREQKAVGRLLRKLAHDLDPSDADLSVEASPAPSAVRPRPPRPRAGTSARQ